ncbi:hypothetical protein ACQR0Z_27935 [Bradyrhizobium sp. HKCCYLS3077]|uniref:hypothetical protein n=1 Tax=unclassified Bradyrhizobium TaxID=2631580 RepID=UPI003EBF203C
MRLRAIGLAAALVAAVVTTAAGAAVKSPWRLAESGNACLINCASQTDACKRVCPTSYSGPCLSACDNQAQFCQQSCQRK